jgi:hypothetical protein
MPPEMKKEELKIKKAFRTICERSWNYVLPLAVNEIFSGEKDNAYRVLSS